MKTFLRTAAVVAFFCFFSAGAVLLQAGSGPLEDRIFPLVLGLFFIGTACFVGPVLFAVAEK
ncbi:MAG: hypothetical protein ABIZ56_01955, partial [Chthoniobacteraceae bacterium]